MNLGELIKALEQEDRERVLPHGFAHPHSYRGYYDQIAFEPATDVTIGSMLDAARSSLGKIFTGWKGGDYRMDKQTDVWLAEQGDCGEQLTTAHLSLWLNGPAPDFRDLARRLAEALREHRNCAVVQSHEEDRLVCTSCGASTARKYVEHRYSCRHAKDRRLLAEAKGMLEEGWESRDI